MKLADGESLLLKTYRNTAPAVALAAHHIADRHGSDALMLVLAADHLIQVLEQLAQHAPDVATQVDACWQALEAQTKTSGHCGLIAASSLSSVKREFQLKYHNSLLGAVWTELYHLSKQQFGYAKTRYRGLMKNMQQILLLFALPHLWMVRKHPAVWQG